MRERIGLERVRIRVALDRRRDGGPRVMPCANKREEISFRIDGTFEDGARAGFVWGDSCAR